MIILTKLQSSAWCRIVVHSGPRGEQGWGRGWGRVGKNGRRRRRLCWIGCCWEAGLQQQMWDVSWLIPGCFLAYSWLFPDCFLPVSWLFPGYFLVISWLFPGFFLSFPVCFLVVSWLFPGCFQAVSWLFSGCFLAVSCMQDHAGELDPQAEGGTHYYYHTVPFDTDCSRTLSNFP